MSRPIHGTTALLEHLDAAYNLARWIVRDVAGAEDVVQEASLRACQFLEAQAVENPKAWFMAVVRNACIDWLRTERRGTGDESYDDQVHGDNSSPFSDHDSHDDPAGLVLRADNARWLREHIERLPRDYREVIVLRELEELSYKEISQIVDVPIGTVMSRLSRARDMLSRTLGGSARSTSR